MNLNLDEFKKLSEQVIEIGDKINESDVKILKYSLKKDLRKALQAIKVESQNLRVATQALGQKTEKTKK